jgi:hypothetical protein
MRLKESQFKENVLGVFNAVLDLAKEQHGLTTINDSVIVGKSNIHYRASLDLVSNADWAVLNGMHTENGALRRVDDGSSHHRAEDSTIGNSKGATSHIFKTNLAITSFV